MSTFSLPLLALFTAVRVRAFAPFMISGIIEEVARKIWGLGNTKSARDRGREDGS